MRSLYSILKLLDWLMQILMPVKCNRVCYVTYPDYTDNAYYVYRHLLETRNDIEHIWLLNDARLTERISREFREYTGKVLTTGHVLRIAPKYSLSGYFLYLTSRFIFHTHGGYPFSTSAFRRKNVSLWHGMPIKCVGRLNRITPNPYPTFGSVHFASSHFFKYIMAAAFGVSSEAVKVCSLPRCDALQHPSNLKTPSGDIRRLLHVPENQRLVLWMPTYRTEATPGDINRIEIRSFLDDLPPWAVPAMDQACRTHACTVIVKLHSGDLLNHIGTSLEAQSLRLLKSGEWLQHEVQLYDLIAASDALISDVSSVLIDYLVTDRPIGILGFDDATYTRHLTFPMEHVLNSQRFDVLADTAAVNRFFSDVAAGKTPVHSPGDISALLYEKFTEKGAEAVLGEVGL